MKTSRSFKFLAFILSVIITLEVFPFAVLADGGNAGGAAYEAGEQTPEAADAEVFYDAVGELEELRTETGKYLRMEDGSFTAVTYPFAVHFEENGRFVEYDNSLSLKEENGGTYYVPKKNGGACGFASESGSGVLYYLGKNGAKISVSAVSLGGCAVRSVSAEPIGKRENKKETLYAELTELDGVTSGVTYREIAPGTDAQYVLFGGSVKETLTLRAAPEKGEWIYRLKLDGLRAERGEQGELLFINEKDEIAYSIPAGCAYDANGALCALRYETEETADGVLLRVIAEDQWLRSSERAYPVTVDPQFDVGGHDSDYINDTYAIEGSPNETIQYGNHFLLVGYATYYASLRMRAFIRITNLPEIPASSVVVKATMDLQQMEPDEWYSYNGQSDSFHLLVKPLTGWPSGLVSWNNMPTVDNTVLDYGTVCYETYSERFSLDVTSMVKEYYTGERSSFGVCLQSYDESQDGYVGFVSADNPNVYTSLAPYYTVHYRDTKGIDSRWEYASQPLGKYGAGHVNLFNGNLVFENTLAYSPRSLFPVDIKLVYNGYLRNRFFTANENDINAPVTAEIGIKTGKGWKLSSIETVVPKTVKNRQYLCYTDADGTELYFYDYSDGITGNYLSEDGYPLTITSENGGYVMRDNEGNSKTFNSNGVMTRITDQSGNYMALSYYSAVTLDNIRYSEGDYLGYNFWNGSGGVFDKIEAFDDLNYYEELTQARYSSTPTGSVAIGASDYLRKLIYETGETYEFTYNASGFLTQIKNTKDGTYLVYAYDSAGRVSSVTEYGSSNAQGQTLGFLYENQKTTVRSSGQDDIYGNSDDILTVHVFDDYGRPVTVYSTSLDGSTVYGESSAAYTAMNTYNNPRKNNALEKSLSSGRRAVNLLSDGGFESGSGWTSSFSSGYSGGYSTAAHFIGQKSMTLSSTSATGTGKYTASVTVPAAGKYTLSAYVKLSSVASGTGGGALVSLNGTDGDAVRGTGASGVQGGWQRIYVTAELPSAGTYSAAVMLKNATGTAYFDCVQLEQGDALSSYNLLRNAGFASGAGSWTAYGGPSAVSYSGRGKVMKINGSPAGYSYFKQTVPVNLPATSAFSISGWANGSSVGSNDPCSYLTDYANESRDFRISLKVNYTEGGTDYRTVRFDPTVRGQWQFASGAFVASDANRTKTISTLEFSVYYAWNANTAYFDDFCLTLEPAQTYKYDANGNLTAISPSDGNTETLVYTGFDLTSAESARGERYTYTYEQDGNGNSTHKVKTATSRAGVTATLDYDPTYGVVTKTTITPTSGNKTITSESEYSCCGNFLSRTTDTFGKQTSYTYDEFWGVLTSVTDARGVSTLYIYLNDLLQSVKLYKSGAGGINQQMVSYSYDSAGRLSAITTNSTVYHFAYDNFGNTVSVTAGTSSTPLASYTYGPYNGKPMTVTYADGTVVSTEYDALDRVKKVKYNGVEEYSVLYDGNGNISAITEASTGYRYDLEYDSIGRLIRYNVTDSGDNVINSYKTYDSTGRESGLYYQAGDRALRGEQRSYDVNGRLGYFSPAGDGYLNYYYDAFERLSGRSGEFYGGTITWENYQYVTVGDKTSTRVSQLEVGNEDHTRTFKYWYDSLGNIYSVYDPSAVLSSWDYSFDQKGQLVFTWHCDEDGSGIDYEYTYDNAGNLLSKKAYTAVGWDPDTLLTTDTYTYSDSVWGDLLTAYNGQPISYDANGNPLSYRGMTLTWAKGRRLATLTKNSATATYAYDRDGLRVQKTVGGVTHTYTYLGDRLVCEEWGGSYLEYIYDETGRPYGLIYGNGPSQDYYYFVRNLQGDVTELLESNGAAVAYYEYDPWGKLLSVKDASGNAITSATHIANINPIRYRGYYYDTESGFYYLKSRYYDPEICRWISPEPNVYLGGFDENAGVLAYNTYVYCANNPVMYVDYTGEMISLFACVVIGAVAGLIIGGTSGAIISYKKFGKVKAKYVFIGAVAGAAIGAAAGYAIGIAIGASVTTATTAKGFASTFKISSKISRQMAKRGWTNALIKDTLLKNVGRSAFNRATGNAATAYFTSSGAYVVIDNITKEIVQISNRYDPYWVVDETIKLLKGDVFIK